MIGVDPDGPDVQRIEGEIATWCVRGSKGDWYVLSIEGHQDGWFRVACDCPAGYLGRSRGVCRHVRMLVAAFTEEDLRVLDLDRLVVG